MPKRQSKPVKVYTAGDGQAAASKFGQMIGEAFAEIVYQHIVVHLTARHPDYGVLAPETGKKLLRLAMPGGTSRQLDNVISKFGSVDPVALFESKWLKDGRHHNDKGAWILQLKEISRHYPTVRGAAAVLAGYWTEGARLFFQSEGRVNMVLVTTDEEVYRSLQPAIDRYMTANQLPTLRLDDLTLIRNSLPRPWDLANCLIQLKSSGELPVIADTWLNFERSVDDRGQPIFGHTVIESAIDELLAPLPETPRIIAFEIALQIESGNVIARRFDDMEEAFEFLRAYTSDPEAILKAITPRAVEDSSVGDSMKSDTDE